MLPRFAIFDDFLPSEETRTLLDFAIAKESSFAASRVTSREGHRIDLSHRNAASLEVDWSEEGDAFRTEVEARFDTLFEAVGIPPFSPVMLELECVAHRDGGRFTTHVDTLTDSDRQDSDRAVSAVYYFYRQPRAFTGGELVVHAIGAGNSAVIKPRHNRLVVFPSFAPHEVMPVAVPGNTFAKARFSINCWLRRKRA